MDSSQKSIPNLPVTLYSEPKETITDQDGYATFNDVEIGKHILRFSYSGKNRKYAVNIPKPETDKGEVRMETVVIQAEKNQFNWMVMILSLIIIGLVILIVKRKK